MHSSAMKYISVSSPLTCNTSNNSLPPEVLMDPDFHPANWRRPSVGKGGSASSLQDSLESVSESIIQERQCQVESQQQICDNEELVGLYSDELENDSLEEDSLEERSVKEGPECATSQYTSGIQQDDSNRRKQQTEDKYFSLRYNPNWKKIKEVAGLSEAKKACQLAGERRVDFSQDSFYLHSSGSSEEKNQQEAKSQEFGTGLLSFPGPSVVVVSNEPLRLQTKGKETAGGCHFRDSPSSCGSTSALQIQKEQAQRAKKDFVAKNKQTLGLPSERINSYLQLHSKKQGVLQEQDHQSKSFQTNNIKSTQSLKGRAFPRNGSQQAPGRAAGPKPWHHRPHQLPELQAVEQEQSSGLQKWLYASPPLSLATNTAAKSETCFNSFPKSRHVAVTTSTYPFQPSLHRLNPAEVGSTASTSKESKKYQHASPNGLPEEQQHLHNHLTLQLAARGKSTNGQAHPNQRTSSSPSNAHFQGLVKDPIPPQGCKGHIYPEKRYQSYAGSLWPPQSSVHSSPKASCTTSQEITPLAEAPLAAQHLLSLLPPLTAQAESGSEVDPESREGNQVTISRSISEGSLMPMAKHREPKVIKKPHSSKAYINLHVKLGGLGPDYEAIKEKKEKLKQQKEYAKQIKEHNMQSITLVQRLPRKPQVLSSVSRQKALEYAKKIPRPKTLLRRQSDEEVKVGRVLPQTLNGDSLPLIASLEMLQNRHEKEKQVVAAFRTLHIL